MKTKIMLVFAMIAVFTFGGCSKKTVNNESEQVSVTPATTSDNKTQSQVSSAPTSTDNKQQSIEVDKGILSVELTLPASMFDGQDIEQVISKAKEEGVSEVTKNADGSLTYKMSKATHAKMVKALKEAVLQTVDELKSGKDFKSVRGVTHNNSFSEFTLAVDKKGYEGSFDGFAALGIGFSAMLYQAFDGVSTEDRKVTINIKDESTGEVFDKVIYPDALKK